MLIVDIQPGLPVPHLPAPQATPQHKPICQWLIGKLALSRPAARRSPNANRVDRGLGHLRP